MTPDSLRLLNSIGKDTNFDFFVKKIANHDGFVHKTQQQAEFEVDYQYL